MSKLRQSARGQPCTLQILGVCNGDAATTVLAHLPSEWRGMARKSPDYCGVFACSSCHDVLDRRVRLAEFEDRRDWYMLRALMRTLRIWFDDGVMRV